MNRRRLMLGIGAALLVGGWGTTQLASRHDQRTGGSGQRLRMGQRPAQPPHYVVVWDERQRPLYIWGIVSMAVGAGLIGFAVLRPTNRKDE